MKPAISAWTSREPGPTGGSAISRYGPDLVPGLRFRRRGRIAAALLASGLLAACKPREATRPPGPVIREVELDGVERFEPDTLLEHLNLRPTKRLAFGNRTHYVPGLEAVDEGRILELYRAHGYFETEVEAIEVSVVNPQDPLRRQRAHVRIAIDEGPPTVLREVAFAWDRGVEPEVRRAVEARAALTVGAPFSIAAMQRGRAEVLQALLERGHAKAEVEEEAWVDPDRRVAVVRMQVRPGPRVRIGRVDVHGLQQVPADLVARETAFAVGKTFSPQRMTQIESAIYGMNVFGSVSATAGEVTPRGLVVDVVVSEAKPQSLRLGVGFGVDPARTEQRVSLLYRHENLGGRLTGFSLAAKVGYAQLPHLFRPDDHGPIAELELGFRKKGFLEKHLVWEERPSFELGIWPGYQFYALRNRAGVSRFFTRYLELGLSYNNRFVDFFDTAPTLDERNTILGPDFRDPYVVSFVQATATVHLTDRLLDPRHGARLSLVYDIASTYLGSQYDFHRFEPDLRLYWQPHDRLAVAARGRIGLIFPYGPNPGSPIDLKFYLGGSNDVRGWPLRRLAPRIVCDDDPDCESIPIGGETMVNANAELRVRAVAELWVAGFFDLGDVQAGTARFDPRGLMYTTGGGLRYRSSVGTFRLDVGGQLNEDPRFPEERRWAIHIGLGEAF